MLFTREQKKILMGKSKGNVRVLNPMELGPYCDKPSLLTLVGVKSTQANLPTSIGH